MKGRLSVREGVKIVALKGAKALRDNLHRREDKKENEKLKNQKKACRENKRPLQEWHTGNRTYSE